mmetsp:Transcript_15998/g.46005  ORF Transcript_15998/g.46005 Transcript_15998/m.46005 type:complete len:90 (+) Transcript_15998:420-689(+)
MKTSRHRIVQVNIELTNDQWRESYSASEDEVSMVRASEDDSESNIHFRILRQIKFNDGSFRLSTLFDCDMNGSGNYEMDTLDQWDTYDP